VAELEYQLRGIKLMLETTDEVDRHHIITVGVQVSIMNIKLLIVA
jgi:hypothetical protein